VAVSETFVVNRRTIGFVEPMEQVTIKARIDSQIAQQSVRDGAMVTAGDVLFILDDRELKAQVARDEAQVTRDRATLARTVADLNRKKDLVQKGAGTPQAYDQAVADEGVARAALAADLATLEQDRTRLDYTIIKAPISGRAGSVAVSVGNLIKANDTGPGLVTITQIDPIRVTLQMSERELAKLQALFAAGTPPQVTAYAGGSSKALATGRATFLDSAVDIASGTITVKAEFANEAAALWPGMFVDVDIAIETIVAVTVIPTVAVQTGQRGPYVFVVKPDQTVEMRQIEVAATDATRLAVKAGLSPGERVVVEGQGRLVSGSRIKDGSEALDTPTAKNSATRKDS
jgi:membrane fusion protein, multidrug efflux system